MINHLIIRAKAFALYNQKKKWLWLPMEKQLDIQLTKFKKLLLTMYQTPYYNDIFRSLSLRKNDLASLTSVEDLLPLLPVISKNEIRVHKDRMVNHNAKGMQTDSSGGSTGAPLNFFHDINWIINIAATTLINDSMQGWGLFRRHAKLWGAPRDLSDINGWSAKIGNIIRNRRFYDSFSMSLENMKKYHAELNLYKPKVLMAYASSIYLLARFIDENNLEPIYPTKSIITTAERLDSFMRDTIQRVFKVPVFDRYGSREVGCIAGECEAHKGMHLHSYDHIIETVDAEGKSILNEPGEIVITDLNNYAFPFIRYRIGDIGVVSRGNCKCGRNSLLLKKLSGRVSGTITTRTGRMIHGEYFTHLFYGIEGVRRFQFVQNDLDSYSLYIVPGPALCRSELDRSINEIKDILGTDCSIKIEFMDRLDTTSSGKFQFTISKVPIDFKYSNPPNLT